MDSGAVSCAAPAKPLLGQVIDVVEVGPLLEGDLLGWDRHVGEQLGDDEGDESRSGRTWRSAGRRLPSRAGGEGDPFGSWRSIMTLHVLAGDGEGDCPMSLLAATSCAGDDAVAEDAGDAVDGGDEDDANAGVEVAGRQQGGVQRRAAAEGEGELEAAALPGAGRHLGRSLSPGGRGARAGTGTAGPISTVR